MSLQATGNEAPDGSPSTSPRPRSDSIQTQEFRHEALLYAGVDEFVQQTSRFIRDAVAADEPILVVVAEEKIDRLRDELGAATQGVDFRDMAEVGHNPARIIPAWYDFVAERGRGGRYIRGIGEPISPDRSPEALVECERHESLLNLAFAGSSWWLLCPYDITSLDSAVIDEALRNHPYVFEGDGHRDSTSYRGLDEVARPFDRPLPEPLDYRETVFGVRGLDAVRQLVYKAGADAGLSDHRKADLVLAVNEAATNSLRHGGGTGAFRTWRDGNSLICEVRDTGRIDQPLAGRQRPTPGQEGGFGMWLVHHLCDLVQVRTYDDGSVVRLHMTI